MKKWRWKDYFSDIVDQNETIQTIRIFPSFLPSTLPRAESYVRDQRKMVCALHWYLSKENSVELHSISNMKTISKLIV